jgi:hypothetical protein
MAIPLVGAAAMAVGRVVAKKLATRAAGGITGAGAKSVGAVYKNQGFSEAVLKQPGYTPKNSLGTGNVTKIPSITKNQQKIVNQMTTSGKKFVKSGNVAKVKAQAREGENLLIPKKPTVKINSNPKRGN